MSAPVDWVLGNCPVGRLAIGIATDICRYRSQRDAVWFGSFDSLAPNRQSGFVNTAAFIWPIVVPARR